MDPRFVEDNVDSEERKNLARKELAKRELMRRQQSDKNSVEFPSEQNNSELTETFIGKLPNRLNPKEEDYKSMLWSALPGGSAAKSVFHATFPEQVGILKASQSIPLIGNAIKYVTEGMSKVGKNALERIGIGGTPGKETIENLKPEDVAKSVEAGERLGTILRPSEASSNPFVAGQEARYARTSKAAYENVKLGQERLQSEKNAINKLLTNIYDKNTASDNKITELYKNATRWNLKPEIVNQLKQDPLIKNAFEDVSNNPAWQRNLGDIQENNIAYLDKVKRSLYDKERGLKNNAPGEAEQYKQARHTLVDVMDEAVPVYKEARELAELKKTRNIISKKLKKSEVSGSEFFKKIIENDEKFKELNYSLRNVPEAQDILKDMKDSWHSLINIEKPSTAAYQGEKSLNQARSTLERVEQKFREIFGKNKNVEAIKYIRSNKWYKDLLNAQQSGKESNVKDVMYNIFGKIMPAVGGPVVENIGKENES